MLQFRRIHLFIHRVCAKNIFCRDICKLFEYFYYTDADTKADTLVNVEEDSPLSF